MIHLHKAFLLALALGTTFFNGGAVLQAESIWARRSDENSLLFFDTRARRVGDLVTVLVSQSTDVDSREDRAMKKSTQAGTKFDFDAETGGGLGTKAANAAFDLNSTSNREFDGGSNYRSEQGFTDRITATVTQVLPNGNLVISGQRNVQVAGEMRALTLSGVIRSIDLSPQNTVNSRFISDFHLTYEGAGPTQSFTRQGWLGRSVNKLWPF